MKEDLDTDTVTFDEVDAPAPRVCVELDVDVTAVEETVRESGESMASLMCGLMHRICKMEIMYF